MGCDGMASKSGSKEKPGRTCSGDAADKDLISELKNRVAVLENELRLKHGQAILDTTERKPDFEKLAEREKLLRNVFECIQDGISVLDKDLNIIQVNPTMEKRYGRHIAGKKCYQAYYHGRSEPCERCPSLRAITTGSAQTEVVYDLNGWSEIYAFPLVDDRGEVTGVIEHVRDINERMRANEALRESEEKFRQMAENIGEVFFIFTQDWKQTVYVSPAYEHVWGRPLTDVFSNSMAWLEGVHPDDRRLPLALVNKNIDGNFPENDSVEFRVVRPDGTVRWILARTYPVMDDHRRIYRITGIAEDITQRKQTEEDLARLAAIVTSSDDAIISKTLDGFIASWNQGAEKLYGYLEAEAKGKFIGIIVPPDRQMELQDILARIRHGERVEHHETERVTKDGRKIDVSITISPIFDASGNPIGASTIARDITERKLAEEQIKAAKAQAELYLDLMGHDINNMHQIALGYLELARGMPPGEDQVKFLDKPVEVLQRSAQLIQNVRKLQKIKEGVFLTQEVDVCEVLRDVQRELGAVPNKAITLNMNRCEQSLVRANELLHDVFANLVSNAIKHTGDKTDIVIDMDVLKDKGNKYYRVMIEDNGPGIPDNFKGLIFNRALRGTSKAKGMGLGLFLVKSLVDSYNGQVWVEDRVIGDHTKGARFVIMLPAIEK